MSAVIGTALAGFSIQQRLIGAAIALLIWLAPAGATWLYMRGQLGAQYELGKSDCEKSSAADAVKALQAFHVEQVELTEKAKTDAEQLTKILATARTRAASLSRELAAYAQDNPLPAGCHADDERVRLYNEARREASP